MTQNDLPGNTPESTDIPNGHSPMVQPPEKPSAGRGCLNVLGWVYIPYIMLPWKWQLLSTKQRVVASIWICVLIFSVFSNNTDSRQSDTDVQRAPAAEVQQAPAEQPAEAPVDGCTAAVRVFASDVRTVKNRAEGMRDRMQKYIDNTHTARELELPVMSAFRELEILDVPTCRPEPAQIVSALNRVRDAELLAFIEMSTAEAGGSSRETALRELDVQMPIVERELAQVDAWLDAIE